MLSLMATAALAGCASEESDSKDEAASKAATTTAQKAEKKAEKKDSEPSDAATAKAFRKWLKVNYPDSPAQLVGDAYVGGFTPTMFAVVPLGTLPSKAETICTFLNVWILDEDENKIGVEKGEVKDPNGDWIARCKPYTRTELRD